jgi:hypothetical protein
MTSDWIKHVQNYSKKHDVSYRAAISKAKSTSKTMKKQQGGNAQAIAAAVGKASDAVGALSGVAGDITKGVLENVQHRRDASGFFSDEGRKRAQKRYTELKWRRKHGLMRWRTDASLSDRDLKKISGLDKYLK